eukprot:PhF_6_TR11329/c0_g1_i2/m.18298
MSGHIPCCWGRAVVVGVTTLRSLCTRWHVFQRRRLLMGNIPQNYKCCAGIMGPECSETFDGIASDTEDCCFMTEVCFCLPCAAHGNRWMIQQHYNLRHSRCENGILGLSFLCSCCHCTGDLITEEGEDENMCQTSTECLYIFLVPCILAQNELHMAKFGYPLGCKRMT